MPSGGVVAAKVTYQRRNGAAKMKERGKEESDVPGRNRHLGHIRVRTPQGGEVKMRKVSHAGVEMGYKWVNAQEAAQVHCRQHPRDEEGEHYVLEGRGHSERVRQGWFPKVSSFNERGMQGLT